MLEKIKELMSYRFSSITLYSHPLVCLFLCHSYRWSIVCCLTVHCFCSEYFLKSENNEMITMNNEIINACLFNTEWNRSWNTWNWKWSRKETKLQKLPIERLMNLLLLSVQGSNLVCSVAGVSCFYQEVSNSDKELLKNISVFFVAVFPNNCL